jgi:hypothetical protein
LKKLLLFNGFGGESRLIESLLPPGWVCVSPLLPPPYSDENIDSYASRVISELKLDIDAILGFSYGALIARSCSPYLKGKPLLLISCILQASEIPFPFPKSLAFLLHFIPSNWIKRMALYWAPFHPNEKKRFKTFVQNLNSKTYKWAVIQGLEATSKPEIHYFRLHGKHDKLFPNKKIEEGDKIDGGHFLFVENRQQMRKWLESKLS